VFPLLNAKGTRLMWQMLMTRAEDDFGIEFNVLEDAPNRARVDWVAQYTFTATGRPVKNHVSTIMQLVAGKIVRHEDTFNLWRWSSQALGPKGTLLGWSPMMRNKIRAMAGAQLGNFARTLGSDRESR